ncbi:isoprenylcysteine carboxylmethyltransferase family protein [Corticibacterium sp. UT-5YL-CI-8]|nr:isoprenylcysteine carboxylmethyltransferase family protein [Tianweitania sp. UT-5YL-CI-8]
MIQDLIARQGNWLFRWRSYILLGFAPLFLLAMSRPEAVEAHFGATADTLYELGCVILAFIGLGIRAFTIGYVPAGTSGRNTKNQLASVLNTMGLYSLTRNPLYFGNAVIYMAVALFLQNLSLALIMVLFLALYLERIIATEERFLAQKFGQAYLDWTSKVPVFFPRLTGWQRPDLDFSVRNVLRREYSGFLAIIATFFVLDQAREFLTENPQRFDTLWLSGLAIGAVVYVVLRSLKKHTHLLDVEGR